MAMGPGKYDDLATYVREQAAAKAVIVIVFDGYRGSGFSVQAEAGMLLPLPSLLRRLADQIEAQTAVGGHA
jgi:hypothetical protein